MALFKKYRWYSRELRFKSRQVDRWSLVIFLVAVVSFIAATLQPTLPVIVRGLYIPCVGIWVLLQGYAWILWRQDAKRRRQSVIPPK